MNLNTRYMGLELKHPLVASASPLSDSVGGIQRLEDGGAAAVVMHSIFEEQIRLEHQAISQALNAGAHSVAESLSYFPDMDFDDFTAAPQEYLELIRRATEAVDIPVIASLNCISHEGWADFAAQLEQAGAKALELNIFAVETDLDVSSQTVEQRYLDSLHQVKQAVSIPVAMKLSPFFSAFGHMAGRLDAAGADALVLFNRFYRPDIDIHKLEVLPTLNLSHASEIRLPLLWIAVLKDRVKASLAATTGVETSEEVIKYLLAGADVVMSAAALMRHGPHHCSELVTGIEVWMEDHGFNSIDEVRGIMSHSQVGDPKLFERVNYLRMLESHQPPAHRI